jgi:hypothetical protein
MKAKTDIELWDEVQYWAGMLHDIDHNYKIAEEIVEAINHYKSQLKESKETAKFWIDKSFELESQLAAERERNNKLYKRSFLAWVTGLTEKDIGRKFKEWLNTPRNLTSNPK